MKAKFEIPILTEFPLRELSNPFQKISIRKLSKTEVKMYCPSHSYLSQPYEVDWKNCDRFIVSNVGHFLVTVYGP